MEVDAVAAAPELAVLKRPAEAEENGGSPAAKKMKEVEVVSGGSPKVSTGSETPASGAHTAAKGKKSNQKSIFDTFFTSEGKSKVPKLDKEKDDAASSPTQEKESKKTPTAKKGTPAAKKTSGSAAKGGASKGASKGVNGDGNAPLLAELRKEVLALGGKDIKGWKISSAVQSPSKSHKAGGGGGGVQYVSPEGKPFASVQAVIKHLGLNGISRTEAFSKAVAYRQDNACPFTIKVQQGQLTVEQLGNLMVEKGPNATFHDEGNLYPIGFKARYLCSETGTGFENSVMDGMDVFSEDVPAFQVKVLGDSAATFVEKRPQGAWKKVKQ